MRKGNGPSAAYYLDIRWRKTEQRYFNPKIVKNLPKIGSIIIVNEVVQEPAYVHFNGLRGCYYVADLTKNGQYICEKMYSKSVRHTTCLHKKDFELGIYSFVEIKEPVYACETSWVQYELGVIREKYKEKIRA